MRYLERLGGPAWFLAAVLIVFPAADLIQGMWPMQPGEVGWRFAAATLVSRIMLTPLLALGLAYAAAVLLEQPRMLKAVAIAEGILAGVLAIAAVVYVLDAVQMRSRVAPSAQGRFDLGAAAAFGKLVVGGTLLVFLAISQWRTSHSLERRHTAARSSTREEASTVVVEEEGRPSGERRSERRDREPTVLGGPTDESKPSSAGEDAPG